MIITFILLASLMVSFALIIIIHFRKLIVLKLILLFSHRMRFDLIEKFKGNYVSHVNYANHDLKNIIHHDLSVELLAQEEIHTEIKMKIKKKFQKISCKIVDCRQCAKRFFIQKIENLRAASANLLLNQGYVFAPASSLNSILARVRRRRSYS
jgi:hypothetical protein